MKDPVLAIKTKLLADTSITTLVSTRIYRDLLPASPVFPAITVTEISDIADVGSHSGSTEGTTRIQCTAWSQGVAGGEASMLSRVIRKSLHRITNTNLTSGTDPIPVVIITDAGARPDANTDVSPKIWMMHRDFIMRYRN